MNEPAAPRLTGPANPDHGSWRVPAQSLELSGRYYRRLLYGGAFILTLALVAAVFVGVRSRVEQFIDDRQQVFLTQRDLVKAEVDRKEARLKENVKTYELLWPLVRAHDEIPIETYRSRLQAQDNVVDTAADLTVTPFTVITTLANAANTERLGSLLRLIRQMSPAPVLRELEIGQLLGGFTYTPDGAFLALVPPLGDAAKRQIRNEDLRQLIERKIRPVEEELEKYAPEKLIEQRIIWVRLHEDPFTRKSVTYFASPVYRDGRRIAVVVVAVPFEDFPTYFQRTTHEDGFFVVARNRQRSFGLNTRNPKELAWSETLFKNNGVFDQSNDKIQTFYRDRTFFITQRVAGPDWIAVYAFDWWTIYRAMQADLLLTCGLALAFLTMLWAFVILFDRHVFSPLQLQSRRVYESEEFNRTVVATAPVGLSVVERANGRIVMQNDIAAALLHSGPDLADAFIESLLHERPGSFGQREKHPGHPHVSLIEASIKRTDGSALDLAVAYTHTRYQNQDAVLVSLTDISNRRQAERLLEEARQAADQANRAKSLFLANMSHEIRTPLHGALGNLELLDIEVSEPAPKERVAVVRRSFDALLALINDLLDLSKVEANELRLEQRPFSLLDVIEQCVQTFAPVIRAKGLAVYCLTDPVLDGALYLGDGHRIRQILLNLLSNAAKFTQSGSVTLTAELASCQAGEYTVCLTVRDTGLGIEIQQQDRIFSAFAQAHAGVAREYGGTGLGLSLSKALAELMGGNLTVQSQIGHGSEFTLELALRAADAAAHAHDGEIAAQQTLLLSCEQDGWRENLAARLRAWGYVVTLLSTLPPRELPLFDICVVACERATDCPPLHGLPGARSVVVISMDGPLHPLRGSEHIEVTGFSSSAIRSALGFGAGEEALAEPPAPASKTERPGNSHALRILVAEDDLVARTLLRHQLQVLGYSDIDDAPDGLRALELARTNNYGLVITDLGMPGLDGDALLPALRDEGLAMPVIVNTANAQQDEKVARETAGFSYVLHKPISLWQLRQAIHATTGVMPSPSPSRDAPPHAAPNKTDNRPDGIDVPLDLMRVFIQSWNVEQHALEDALNQTDGEHFRRRLHRLRGALLMMGLRSLAQDCKTLRQQAGESFASDKAAVRAAYQSLAAQINTITRPASP